MIYTLKEKTVYALLVGSDQKFSDTPEWNVSFTVAESGALEFVVEGDDNLLIVHPGNWVIEDIVTGKMCKMDDRAFRWLLQAVY